MDDQNESPVVEAVKVFKFRHKAIRRFCVGEFEFKNFELTIEGEEKRELFIRYVKSLPRRDSINIVEVNTEAAAAAEKPVTSDGGVVRGAANAADLLTAADRERLKQQGSAVGAGIPGANLTAQAASLTGFLKK